MVLNFSQAKVKLPDALQEEINLELEKDLYIDDTANLGKSVRVKMQMVVTLNSVNLLFLTILI